MTLHTPHCESNLFLSLGNNHDLVMLLLLLLLPLLPLLCFTFSLFIFCRARSERVASTTGASAISGIAAVLLFE